MNGDLYRRVVSPVQSVLREKRSEFITAVLPAATVEEARKAIEKISKDHINATHNCWAYRVGYPETAEHCSDDGEPSGTAGRPILGAILRRDLRDLAVVVTRYFGGVKLGVRGLIEAYASAAEEALSLASTEEIRVVRSLKLVSDYQRFQDLLHLLRRAGLDESFWNVEYLERVAVTAHVPMSLEERVQSILESYDCAQLLAEPFQWDKKLHGIPA